MTMIVLSCLRTAGSFYTEVSLNELQRMIPCGYLSARAGLPHELDEAPDLRSRLQIEGMHYIATVQQLCKRFWGLLFKTLAQNVTDDAAMLSPFLPFETGTSGRQIVRHIEV